MRPPGVAVPPGSASTSVAIQVDSPEEADRIFHALSVDGKVDMPIGETFWSQRFGMFTDRYGKPRMVNCSKPRSD